MENLDYLLKSIELSQNIKSNLENIVKSYTELYKIINDYCVLNNVAEQETEDETGFFKEMIILYQERLEIIEWQIQNINKVIYDECNHQFETDLIDIDPDNSKTIKYCTICGFTK